MSQVRNGKEMKLDLSDLDGSARKNNMVFHVPSLSRGWETNVSRNGPISAIIDHTNNEDDVTGQSKLRDPMWKRQMRTPAF